MNNFNTQFIVPNIPHDKEQLKRRKIAVEVSLDSWNRHLYGEIVKRDKHGKPYSKDFTLKNIEYFEKYLDKINNYLLREHGERNTCKSCEGTGTVEGDSIDEIEPCRTCCGSGKL
ncbi:hypothetical protein [Tenacibaculum phage Larrie]|nr:hypothetical protein [Tenacibaculum phage Larrie]